MSDYIEFSPEKLRPQHDRKASKFFIQVNQYEALLEYAETSPGVWDLYHTEVPVPIQGRGLGKILALEAFEYVAKNDLRMIISCSHLQKYFKENQNSEYQKCLITVPFRKSMNISNCYPDY